MGSGGERLPRQQSAVTAGAFLGQAGQTSGRNDRGKVKLWPWMSKLCHTQLFLWFVFSVLVWGRGWEFLSLKPQDEQLLLTQALEVISLAPLLQLQRKITWEKTLRLSLWTCYQPALSTGKDRNAEFGTDVRCSASGRCCLQQPAAGICTQVATLQSNNPSSMHISRKPEDDSPACKPEAMSDAEEKFSVEHRKSFFSV